MRVYNFGENIYYESLDFFDESYAFGEDLKKHVNAIIKCFTKRRLFRELLKSYSQKNNLRGYILLHAHGVDKRKEWAFTDGKKTYVMQNWIDRVDGQSLAILLKCCNPKNYDICSDRSVIIYPRDSINVRNLVQGGHLRIYVPQEGYLEDNYYKLRRSIDKSE